MQSRSTGVTEAQPSGTSKPVRGNDPSNNNRGSVKDTIESILVAFILAFIFRAFIVEAFVIPTGSMAPTLLGAHMRFRCHDCGYAMTTNFSAPPGNDLVIPPRARGPFNVNCPNCGYEVPITETTLPPVHYGDRILVLKYAYLLDDPERWDVVVFKSPDPVEGADDYTTNYIKRLVGKPGESVLILDGDVYIGDGDAPLITDFHIVTKPRHAQEAMWRVVYDNDYLPLGRPRAGSSRWVQPWQMVQGEGWDVGERQLSDAEPPAGSNGRVFRFDNANGGSTLAFDRTANPGNHAFTDWLAYDRAGSGAAVSDLNLDFYYTRKAGDGPLRLMLSKYDDVFTAELTPSHVQVFRQSDGGTLQPMCEPIAVSITTDQPMHVEFQNLDYQITLRIDGRNVFASTPQQYHPDVRRLLERFDRDSSGSQVYPSVQIQAERQTCDLSHIVLQRDIYYTNGSRRGDRMWAGPKDFPDNVMRLGEKEFFVLGDNSIISGDARTWMKPLDLPHEKLQAEAGRVPERFMLGKAFFVYWPAGYKPADFSPAIVPNFGEMRFIH